METFTIQDHNSETANESFRRVRRMLVAGTGLVAFQQLCGVTSVIFRMEEVFYQLINSGNDLAVKAQTFAIVLSLTQVSGVIAIAAWGEGSIKIVNGKPGITEPPSALSAINIYAHKYVF